MKNISKVYRAHMIETHALRDFAIHVKEGEFVTVTGPSGSGKTSFLSIAGLLEESSSGEKRENCPLRSKLSYRHLCPKNITTGDPMSYNSLLVCLHAFQA